MRKLRNLKAGIVKAWLMQEGLVTLSKKLSMLFMRHNQIIYSVFVRTW